MKQRHRILIMVMAALATTPSMAQLPASKGAPAGFEQLEAPRATMVAFYYGGEPLGNFAAHTTPTTLQFDAPEEVVAALHDVADKPGLIAALRQPLPVNAEQLCSEKRTENCGKIAPETVGVIYDENRLAGELFINSHFLAVVDSTGTRYLPLPKRELSSIYQFSGAVNGTDQQTPNYTITDNSTYAFGEGRLITQSTVTNSGLRFDTAAASVDREGVNATAGLFQSRAMELISDRDIAGASISTSRKTIVDQHKTDGNTVLLFLARRAFVSIYREGRLYSSRAYEAGNQEIDTAELPEGAYDITLKIQDADGSVREEKRFFVKNQELPPPGKPDYFLQGGVIRQPASNDSTVPQFTGVPIVRAGATYRLTDNAGVRTSVLGVQDRAIMEDDLFWIQESLQAHATGLASSKGDIGAAANLLYTHKNFSSSLDVRRLSLSSAPIPGYSDMTSGFTQGTLTASYMIEPTLTVGLRASYSKDDAATSNSSSVGPYAEWRIWQEGESMLGLSADAARTDGRDQGDILLNFTYRFGENGVSGTAGNSFGKSNGGALGNVRVWHDHETPGEGLAIGGGLSGDRNNQIANADGDWRNAMGRVHGSVQQSFGQNQALGYGGNVAFNAAQLSDEVHVGGTQNDGSAVIVEVGGDTGDMMKIYVNSMVYSTVQAGSKQVLYLTPFHSYNIRIAPEKNSLLDYDSSDHKVTLYPGNVTKLHWDVKKFYVVSATIHDENGKPLADALLSESRDKVTTNAHGRVQAELSSPEKMIFTTTDHTTCEVALPQNIVPVNGVLLFPQPLTCTPVSPHAAPH